MRKLPVTGNTYVQTHTRLFQDLGEWEGHKNSKKPRKKQQKIGFAGVAYAHVWYEHMYAYTHVRSISALMT